MDVTHGGDAAAANAGADRVADEVGARVQKLFQDFLEEWQDPSSATAGGGRDAGEAVKYLKPARELQKPERNTLTVSMKDVEQYNSNMANLIMDDYYRLYPFLCTALRNFVQVRMKIYFWSSWRLSNFLSPSPGSFWRSLCGQGLLRVLRGRGRRPHHAQLVDGEDRPPGQGDRTGGPHPPDPPGAGLRHLHLHGLPDRHHRRGAAVQVHPAGHLQEPGLQQPLTVPPGRQPVPLRRLPEGPRAGDPVGAPQGKHSQESRRHPQGGGRGECAARGQVILLQGSFACLITNQ